MCRTLSPSVSGGWYARSFHFLNSDYIWSNCVTYLHCFSLPPGFLISSETRRLSNLRPSAIFSACFRASKLPRPILGVQQTLKNTYGRSDRLYHICAGNLVSRQIKCLLKLGNQKEMLHRCSFYTENSCSRLQGKTWIGKEWACWAWLQLFTGPHSEPILNPFGISFHHPKCKLNRTALGAQTFLDTNFLSISFNISVFLLLSLLGDSTSSYLHPSKRP